MKLHEQLVTGLAKRVLKKYSPRVIAVSGSVGKTSTKEAVAAVMAAATVSRTSPKNYNNELGVPLSVLGEMAPGKNPFAWAGLVLRAARKIIFKDATYPQTLVLEYAGDHVGDVELLMKAVPVQVGVLTPIAPTHTEFYGTVEAIAESEGKIVTALGKGDIAVMNADHMFYAPLRRKVKARAVSFGFAADADVRCIAAEPFINWDTFSVSPATSCGMNLRVATPRGEMEFLLLGTLGEHSATSFLGGVAVGIALDIPTEVLKKGLMDYLPPKGRMRVLPGVQQTILLDDTYNSSPDAVRRALETLRSMPVRSQGARRFAVLGDMAELGALTENAHREVGMRAAEMGVDVLVCVGEKSRDTARAAEEAGMDKAHVVQFATPEEAGTFVQNEIDPGDVVLVKGSQSARMEKVTKELLAEPARAEEFLVRQDAYWLAR